MDITTIIKYSYKLYTSLPYILTLLFLILAIYGFYKNNDRFIEYLFNTLVGTLSIICLLICMNFILPNMLTTEFSTPDILDKFSIFLDTVIKYIVEFTFTTFAIYAIIASEELDLKNRFFIPTLPICFITLFWITENVCNYLIG